MNQYDVARRFPSRGRIRVLKVGLAAVAIGALLALGPASLWNGPSVLGTTSAASRSPTSSAAAPAAFPSVTTGSHRSHSVPAVSAAVEVGAPRLVQPIPSAFWGLNVVATHGFGSKAAAAINATPVDYIRFPGGLLGEEYNYTSGVITATNGAQSNAGTTVAQFVSTCETFNCHAILQLPAEIDSPATDAYYANYVVHTLKFQPAYWEIGNDPSGWTHYKTPWSQWATKGGGNTTPVGFALEVGTIITAVTLVDPGAHFLALGTTDWVQSNGIYYDKSWVSELAAVDGTVLSGITIHSYINGGGPTNPSWAELFANLHGIYSLPAQVEADRSYIQAACPTCTNLQVFVSEINAAQLNSYTDLLTTFAGPLYIAAEVTQGLNLQVSNLDWFCYVCTYQGAWSQGGKTWQMQYYLFEDMLNHLENGTLTTTVAGPSWLMASATFTRGSGLSLLLVNVNTTHAARVNLSESRLEFGASATEYLWKSGSGLPTSSSITIGNTIRVPTHSILLISVGSKGVHRGPYPTTSADHHHATIGSMDNLPFTGASAPGTATISAVPPAPSGFSPLARRAPEA